MGRERELKYTAHSSEPPDLPRGWTLGRERAVAQILDTYLDHAATLSARGWALRRRETIGAPTRYTLKRDSHRVGALHQRDEIELVSEQVPPDIVDAIGSGLASELEVVLTLKQQRRGWPLHFDGRLVADLTVDRIEAGGAQWFELEIEFAASVSDAEALELAAILEEHLAHIPGFAPSRSSKVESAIAARGRGR